MLDQITDSHFENLERKPDPRDLYRSQVFPYERNVLQIFTQDEQVIDLDIAIEKFIGLATNNVPAAKARCAKPEARDFIFSYVHQHMETDLFVARMRVMMLQHVMVATNAPIADKTMFERALGKTDMDRHTRDVLEVCNTADHHAMRLQLIRVKVNEAVLRIMSDHMVLNEG